MYIHRYHLTAPQAFSKNATELELRRQVTAVNITNDLQIKRKNKLHYKVQSQSDDGIWYDVIKRYGHNLGGHQEGEWTCNCLDFIYRHIICKHCYAVTLWKEQHKKVTIQDAVQTSILPISNEVNDCIRCKSELIIKYGIRHNKSGDIQRYRCKSCNHKFIVNIGFERSRANPKAVTVALDLYFKGVSLRKVCDHLKQFHNISVTHVSIIKWIRKFVFEIVTMSKFEKIYIQRGDELEGYTMQEYIKFVYPEEWGGQEIGDPDYLKLFPIKALMNDQNFIKVLKKIRTEFDDGYKEFVYD